MGLDMYLNAKRYLWHTEDEVVNKITSNFPELGEGKIKQLTAEVGYWRKANCIHKWFVDNVQEGEDDCGDYEVSNDKLKELLDLIDQVLANKKKAHKLLPNQSGFFFGGTEYDDYYYADLRDTKRALKPLIKRKMYKREDMFQLRYTSSW